MQIRFISLCILLISMIGSVQAQSEEENPLYKKYYVGSSAFMLGNLIPTNRPDFVQLNFGYRITPKNVVSIEAKTWKYAWPIGIPYGSSFEDPEEQYPGFVREFGVALVYQKFWWKGMYTSIHAMNALQCYVDNDKQPIQKGYQLFLTYRTGYHVPLFNNRFFIEPSIAITHWPINTNVPESFAHLEAKWNNFFLPEPGFHFGLKF